MSTGDVLAGETITSPAALSRGEAATAEPEHRVPMTPITCGLAMIRPAPALPPSAEHMPSMGSPSSTSCPWMAPKSLMASSALYRAQSETDGTTVMHRLMRGYSDEEIELISAYLGQSGDAP